jgi:hypothetical protein
MLVQWGWKTGVSGGVADKARPWRDGSRMSTFPTMPAPPDVK